MKEIRQILQLYDKAASKTGVLLTVIKVEGSSYRRPGARMYLTQSGEWVGGISGGCLEADALKKAQIVLFQNKARILIYDTSNDDPMQIGVGLGCNGIIHVLVIPIDSANQNNPLEKLKGIVFERKINCLITILNENQLGSTFLESEFKTNFPSIKLQSILKNEIIEFEDEKNKKIKILIEKIKPEIRFLIFGNHADVNPMAKLASELGWLVEITGNTNKLSNETSSLATNLFPKGNFPSIDNQTVAITMCHDFETDFINLKYLLQSEIKYIGLLGPKKRFNKMVERLKSGPNIDLLSNINVVYGPSGLDIGAETPEEIAISVCSEIVAVLANRNAGFLKERQLPIYQN